jgi:GT2 family glycosyltransferase
MKADGATRKAREAQAAANCPPDFSVILPVYHSGDLLAKTLAALTAQDVKPERMEVLVAGPADEAVAAEVAAAAAADARCAIKYLPVHSRRRARLMNAACAAARGHILAVTDDDCLPAPDWLRTIGEAFAREPKAGIVGGPDRFVHRSGGFGLAHDWVLNSFVGTGGCRRADGRRVGAYYPRLYNMAIPRELAMKLALQGSEGEPQVFDERLPVHENVDLARRVMAHGRRTVNVPELVIEHYRDSTYWTFVGRNFLMGRASRALGAHRFAHRALVAALLAVVALGGSAAFWPPGRAALLFCVGAYAVVLLASGVAAAVATRHPVGLLAVPPLVAGLHLARALGYMFPARASSKE